MKTAIEIPDDVFEEADRLARRLRKSRSRLYGDALRGLPVVLALLGCKSAAGGAGSGAGTGPGADGGASGTDGGASDADGPGGPGGPGGPDDGLGTLDGCEGVFNTAQLLDFYLVLEPADWETLKADESGTTYYEATFACDDETPITVGVRRKRSGGTEKPGLKVDINWFVPDQTYQGLKKLTLENGVGSGEAEDSAEVRDLVAEYLAWRLMALGEVTSSRAAFVRVHVNGEWLGVYLNIEQVDKVFLASRFGDDTGWLYKKSGGDDGLRTHETDGLEDPYDEYFCFWRANGCEIPSAEEITAELPDHLNIDQMLRLGAVNALMANTDSPIAQDNNYYWYDWDGGGREYLPWDLDTMMRDNYDVFTGNGAENSRFVQVLFTDWEDDYDAILTEMLEGAITIEEIESEVEAALAVAAEALDADPYLAETTADAESQLLDYWEARLPAVESQVEAHE